MKMKDKKAVQAAEKAERKQQERAAKLQKRDKEPALDRRISGRSIRPTILIVREGENTEKHYFEQFRQATCTFLFKGAGTNTKSLIAKAKKEQENGDFEEVWCVFDKDSFPLENFDNAINEARAADFKIGWSNQSFEYWLLLHFEDHQGAGMDRKRYADKINGYLKKLGAHYDGEGSKTITDRFFNLLEGVDEMGRSRRALAIQRAKRNHKHFEESGTTPANSESCTTVYTLVEGLLKFLPIPEAIAG